MSCILFSQKAAIDNKVTHIIKSDKYFAYKLLY